MRNAISGLARRAVLSCALAAGLSIAALEAAAAPPAQGVKVSDTSALTRIEEVKSPGGVSAWLVREPSIPMIAMNMAWRAGAAASDPVGKEGANAMLAFMMNEGAGDLTSQQFGARMEDLNMAFGCEGGRDFTSCSMSTLSKNRVAAFDLLAKAMSSPRFDAEPIDRAKREFTAGLIAEETSPRAIAGYALNDILAPGHPYSRRSTVKTIAAIGRDDIIAQRAAVMTRDRLLVTVVGDISAEELKPLLDKTFSGLPATSNLPTIADVAAVPAAAQPVVKLLPQPQTLVIFSAPGLRRKDPDFYAAYVLNYILGGGGFASRLMDTVREKGGLTYGIGTELSISEHDFRWQGSAGTQNATAGALIAKTKEVIGQMAAEGPNEDELKDAKAYLTGAYPMNFDSNAKIAANLMSVRKDDLGIDYVAKRNSLIEAVTLADLKRVASKYLKPESFTWVLVGQPQLDAKTPAPKGVASQPAPAPASPTAKVAKPR